VTVETTKGCHSHGSGNLSVIVIFYGFPILVRLWRISGMTEKG